MAPLPDPTDQLAGEDKAVFDRMASVRAHAEGRAGLVEVYVRMFNNPVLARSVGALGEQLRFHGTLPDDVRELAILRFATHQGSGYEWSHHQRPAELAGVSAEALAELAAVDERQARIVELRFFGEMDRASAAELLGISVRTLTREWGQARAWLLDRLRA